MRAYYLQTLLLVLISISSFAQKGTIQGVVSDALSGETLIGAAVIYGDGQGVITDFDGKYSVELDYGRYTMSVSYVGFEPLEKTVVLEKNILAVNFKLESVQLSEAEVVADVAIERETPVAFTNISPLQIQEELGSQPIPMILNSTPGVYATTDGADGNGPSVSIRGFKQRNVSVMLDGIPVNDMETGGVFWNNWFGLDMVTQTMQVQRGLGASKLALPAIGGTINIQTEGIESKKKTSVKQEVSTFGSYRTSIGHTSGRTASGWGYTLAASFQKAKGYNEQTNSQGYFYYLKIQKELGKHILSVSAMGAPSERGVRSYRQKLATYSHEYSREIVTGSEDDYMRLSNYHQEDLDIESQNLNAVDKEAAISELNDSYSYENTDEYLNERNEMNFIDTVGVVEKGLKYNVHWGKLNGNIQQERTNKYHKPTFNLRDSWHLNDKWYVSNIAYMSLGKGGGSRLSSSLGTGDYDDDYQVDLQRFYDSNTIGGIFGPPIDGTYSDTELKSSRILRKLYNNHFWAGILSTFQHDPSEDLAISGGLDFRYYEGEHYAEVHDLLGGDYYVNDDDANSSTNQDKMKREGDKIDFHNRSFVKWGGAFVMLEYKKQNWNSFINLTGVYQGYDRIDYFALKDESGNYERTGIKWIPGYTIKAGGNYNLNEFNNVYMNLGYLNRTPVFSNVIGYSNDYVENTENELIKSIELGYSYSKKSTTFKTNLYYTDWNNRPLDRLLSVELDDGSRISANIPAMSAVHMGVESDLAVQFHPKVRVNLFVSFGDWKWDSKQDSIILRDPETQKPYIDPITNEAKLIYYDAYGVKVGDSPQSQMGISVKWDIVKNLYIKPRFTYFSNHYSEFDPFSLFDGNEGRQSWKIPAYGLLDIHVGYAIYLGKSKIDIRASVFNALNTSYISSAMNNQGITQYYYSNPDYDYPSAFRGNFDASSASVFMGYGLRSNLSVKVRF